MTTSLTTKPSLLPSRAQSRAYSLFGLQVLSDFELPVPQLVQTTVGKPAIRFLWGDPSTMTPPPGEPVNETRCSCPKHAGRAVMRVYRDGDHMWLWHEDIGFVHVGPGGCVAHVYPDTETIDEQTLRLLLIGLASTYIMHLRGYPCLHASAVVTPRGAIAFLGPKGQGKSTMAAGFLRQGAALLTDDILPLTFCGDGLHALPSLPIMKLWDQSVEHALSVEDELPNLAPAFDKKLFMLDERFEFAQSSSPLRALYILNRYDPAAQQRTDVTIAAMPQRDALMALFAQTTLKPYLSSVEMARLIPIYQKLLRQAAVRVVSFPSGFEHQDVVHERMRADIEVPA